jgi:cytochrome bd-type quinol oxidase subunit 2
MTVSYRPLLAASAVTALVGGPLHPDADPEGPLRDDLVEMTADPLWVTGHALIALSTVLLAAGLWALHRRGGLAPRTTRAVRVAAVAVSLYVVETLFHLFAYVDSEQLAAGDTAPVAATHVVLSAVLYPVSGAALVLLGIALLREGTGRGRTLAGLLVVAGALHAVSVPVVLLAPDTDGAPLFASSAVLLAVWSLLTAVTRVPQVVPAPAPSRELQPAG